MLDSPPDLVPEARRWLARRSSTAECWPVDRLLPAKARQTVSVILPARNEQATVGQIVRVIRRRLMREVPLVDEVLVVDSHSRDRTAAVAAEAGATVVGQDDWGVPGLPRLEGKGAAMWTGLARSHGDIVVYIDADLRNFNPAFVTGLLGPLLMDEAIGFVKGFCHRPLRRAWAEAPEPYGGGRVTELVARPMLNLFWPQLAGFVQPLVGEYASRRCHLVRVPFAAGYGVDAGLLIDVLELLGLDGMAQVDLGVREHRHQATTDLGRMAAQIMVTLWARLERRSDVVNLPPPREVLSQFTAGDSGVGVARHLHSCRIATSERPPLADLLTSAFAGRPSPPPPRKSGAGG